MPHHMPLPEHLTYTSSRYVANSDPGPPERPPSRIPPGMELEHRENLTGFHPAMRTSLHPWGMQRHRRELPFRTEFHDLKQRDERVDRVFRHAKAKIENSGRATTSPYKNPVIDDVALALQEAYAQGVLETAPHGWADAGTQTPSTVHREKGITRVTKGTVTRKVKDKKNPRRQAAIRDLEEIKLRRRYGSVYDNPTLMRKNFNEFLLPRAQDIVQYFDDTREGGPGTEFLCPVQAYSHGDLVRSNSDPPRLARVRRRTPGTDDLQFILGLASALNEQRLQATRGPDPIVHHGFLPDAVQVQTRPMRSRSASIARPKKKTKHRAARSAEVPTNSQGRRSWTSSCMSCDTNATLFSEPSSSDYASASSQAGQKRVRQKKRLR